MKFRQIGAHESQKHHDKVLAVFLIFHRAASFTIDLFVCSWHPRLIPRSAFPFSAPVIELDPLIDDIGTMKPKRCSVVRRRISKTVITNTEKSAVRTSTALSRWLTHRHTHHTMAHIIAQTSSKIATPRILSKSVGSTSYFLGNRPRL
jgi:hypothetical protein